MVGRRPGSRERAGSASGTPKVGWRSGAAAEDSGDAYVSPVAFLFCPYLS